MRKKSKIKISIFFFGIIFVISTISNHDFKTDLDNNKNIMQTRDKINLKAPKSSGAYNEPFIHIDGNWSAATGKDWFKGDGSLGNPYIIENVTIDASNSPTKSGIFINNSKNEYFIIKNCTLINAGIGEFDSGIKLENTNNGTLSYNNCSNNDRMGIFLNNCDNNSILGNNVNGNIDRDGILLWNGCDNNTISNNTANKNNWAGIRLTNYCNNNTISNNIANDNNWHGIYIYNYCDNNTISNNVIIGGDRYGIFVCEACHSTTILDNYIYFKLREAIRIFFYTVQCDSTIIKRNVMVSDVNKFISDYGTNTIIGVNYYLPIPPLLCIDIIEQSFLTTEFAITINISSSLGFDLWLQSVQIWWGGIIVPSNNITELANGLYNISLTPIFVNPGNAPILFNMTIKSANHQEKYFEFNLAIEPKPVEKPPTKQLKINIINSVYTSECFNLTLEVTNRSGDLEIGTSLSGKWNGIDLNEPENITNNGDGTFNLTLGAILTSPGEPGILLSLIVSKPGYEDGELNTKIAVDPETISKIMPPSVPNPPDGGNDDEKGVQPTFPVLSLIIIGLGITIAAIAIIFIKKRGIFTREI